MLRAAPRPFSPGQASPAQSAQADTSQPLDPKLPKLKVFGIVNQKTKNQSFWSKNSNPQKTKNPKTLKTQKTKLQKPKLLFFFQKKTKTKDFGVLQKLKRLLLFWKSSKKPKTKSFGGPIFAPKPLRKLKLVVLL